MRRLNYVISILMIFFITLVILIFSSNLVLRVSTVYTFHFNDSQVMNEVPYNIKGADISDEVGRYFLSFGKTEFQVYEDNRIYKDPVFKDDEQDVMKRARSILNIELGIGLVALAASLAVYIYLVKGRYIEALKDMSRISMVLTGAILIIRPVLWSNVSFRGWLYNTLIGIKLHENSVLAIALGDPLYKTYMIFATILGAALLGVFVYVNYKITKQQTIFS